MSGADDDDRGADSLVKHGPVDVTGASCIYCGGIVDGQSRYVDVGGGPDLFRGALSSDEGVFVLVRGAAIEAGWRHPRGPDATYVVRDGSSVD
ncbi:MAG TPA: hypothetical protein VIF09_22175 [Polyangiaceae bacterium]